MNWSGLSAIVVRIFGVVIFTNALVTTVHLSQILALQIWQLHGSGQQLHDYWFVLFPILPSLLYICIGLFFLTNANGIASRFGGVEINPAEQAGIDKLESVLISVAGLYFIADAAVDIARLFADSITMVLRNGMQNLEYLLASSSGALAAAITKAIIGFVFIIKRKRLAHAVQRARDWPA
jgi:hypothetical protein